VDIVRFGKSPSGASYALANGIWQWSDPFPGRLNAPPTQAVLGAKLAAGETISSGAKRVSYRPMTIADAREEALDSGVIVRGIVSVLPGVFGKQYFYIFDNASGIQVYQYKSDFPDLKIGDNVEITGVISQAQGAKRIKIKNRSAIDILATDGALEPLALEPEDAGEDSAGALIKTNGEITEIKTNYMYLDNGAAEMKVYFKKNAKIDKTKFKEGENAEITGIWEQGTNEMQLWPRGQADIAVLGPSDDLVKKEELVAENNSKQTAEKYLLAFAGGLSALLLGLLARAKGAVAIKAVKSIIASIIKRG
jgi:DNA/RNA endonuclease YhcR with UshA esterase domain